MNAEERIQSLEVLAQATWKSLLERSKLAARVKSGVADRRLYALYMLETYHYTLHNARNQAVVIQNPRCTDIQYMKYCLKHALEECGHEMMAFHDFKSLGYAVASPADFPAPTPATDTFVAYLYRIAQTGNPVQRLGYSFWAENAYEYIMPLLGVAVKTMALEPKNMTFFVDHAKIDEAHARDVAFTLERACKTDADWEDVKTVMLTTLELTGRIMDAVDARYVEWVLESNRFDSLFKKA